MSAFIRSLTLILLVLPALAQPQAGDPPPRIRWAIPPTIAKLPEKSDFHGRWVRYDGTYSLQIRPGETEGSVNVEYFNPSPINVESAAFEKQGDQPLLTVVLVDEGYPGSIYRLVFVPERRILAGEYVRPDAQAMEVYFVESGDLK